jgi:hypothetical protein
MTETTTPTKTKRRSRPRAARKFAKLVAVLHQDIKSTDPAIRQEAIATLAKVLIHVDEVDMHTVRQEARTKAAAAETDPSMIVELAAQAGRTS